MTPPPPPPIDDDPLSADLDGEAGDDVRARIASDDDARNRQDALRSAADAVRTPVPPLPPDVVDELVGAALAEHPVGDDATDAASRGDNGTPVRLAPRRGRGHNPRKWLVAAIVVVLAGVGLGLIRNGLDESNKNDTATKTAADSSSSTEERSAGAESDANSGAAPTTTAPPADGSHGALGSDQTPTTVNRFRSVTQLGSYATTDALRAALRTSFPAGKPATTDKTELTAVNRCTVVVENQMSTEPAKAAATATIAGRPVLVYVLRAARPGSSTNVDLVVAVDREACTPDLSFYRDR